MRRRRFWREFKVEAVRLVRERGVNVARAARDLAEHLGRARLENGRFTDTVPEGVVYNSLSLTKY